jgi:nitroreductase
MDEARRALAGEEDPEEGFRGQSETMRSMRQELRGCLRGFKPQNPEDERRVTQALSAAIAEIRGGSKPETKAEKLLSLLAARRSMGLSRLKPDPVEPQLIERMLEAANWAPSNEDTEPWRFTVFTGDGREKLAELFARIAEPEGARKRAFAAPVWISIGMSPQLSEDGTPLMPLDDEIMAVACAVQNLHLMAQAQGLAGMWHSKGTSVHPIVAEGLGLKPPARLLGFFMCGWPAGDWLTSSRRPLAEKVTWVDGSAARND